MRNFLILFALLFLSGCAMGHTTNFQGTSNFKLGYQMPPISLGVVDKRPYVLDGNKTPTYSGTQRSIGGVPWDVNTASGNPLAQDLQGLIGTTLVKNGYNVENSNIFPMTTTEIEAAKILSQGGTKSVLLLLNEWRTHVYFNPIFEYDLKMSVIDTEGKIISSSFEKGTIEFGEDKKVKNFGEAVTIVFDELFNDQNVKSALLTDHDYQVPQVEKVLKPENQARTESKCTTDQILKMKEMGMSNLQIKAACTVE